MTKVWLSSVSTLLGQYWSGTVCVFRAEWSSSGAVGTWGRGRDDRLWWTALYNCSDWSDESSGNNVLPTDRKQGCDLSRKKSLLKLLTFPTILLFLCVKCGKINRIEQNKILVMNVVVCCVQAQLALSQFHVTDRMTRQQYYYLNLLEPEPHSSETHVQGNTLLLLLPC